jgi:integrase
MATEMLDAGVPIAIVAARLSHTRSSTTLNVYAHAVPGGDQLAAEILRKRVKDAMSESGTNCGFRLAEHPPKTLDRTQDE